MTERPTTEKFDRPGLRLTASDRPGVAQPVPERDVPVRPWSAILIAAATMTILMLGAWEWQWRAFGATPIYRNSDGTWAEQRERIDRGEGDATVIVGSSRVLFDVQLPVWEKITGKRPIQLALEGSSPMLFMEDLADDPDFTGNLVVGVTPGLFFSGRTLRADALSHYRKRGPSQRSGHWLSKHLLEPFFAFYEPDFALATVIKRQPWPARPGLREFPSVRRLALMDADRNTYMWDKIPNDPEYRAIVRNTWAARLGRPAPDMDTPEKAQVIFDAQIARAVAAVDKLRARGVKIVFVRAPSIDDYYVAEQRDQPRAKTWDLLLQRTGTRGIHFEDYPQLQGFESPEWSHLSASAANEFTAELVPLVQAAFAKSQD